MSLLNSSLAGANYMTSNNEDRETATNGAAEFTRRKKWPEILLKELVGASIFCLKPVLTREANNQQQGGSRSSTSWSWKIIYSSPAVGEMLGQKPAELEGKDFLDLVFAADHPQIQSFFMQLLQPTLPHQASSSSTTMTVSSLSVSQAAGTQHPSEGESRSTYVRMVGSGSSPNSNSIDASSGSEQSTPSRLAGPVVWELRGHASGIGEEHLANVGTANFGMPNQGTVVPHAHAAHVQGGSGGNGGDGDMKGKAIWVMGRRVGESSGENEGAGTSGSSSGQGNTGNSNPSGSGSGNANGQSLDAFLELKLENERLREELRDLQLDLDEETPARQSAYPNLSPTKPTYAPSSSPSTTTSSPNSSRSSSPSRAAKPKTKSRPKPEAKEKRRKKSTAAQAKGAEGEGMHVCVTCGRTDSPEWRKGPLGPKTLCNACGLRWAKRNSAQPTRKDRKPNDGKK